MVNITDKAREKIQEVLDQNEGKHLRIFMQGMGWGGPRVGMALDEPSENEQPVHVDGIDILIEEFVRPFVEGATLDYVQQGAGGGFTITGSGGCC